MEYLWSLISPQEKCHTAVWPCKSPQDKVIPITLYIVGVGNDITKVDMDISEHTTTKPILNCNQTTYKYENVKVFWSKFSSSMKLQLKWVS